jgi:hypothetical protein
VIDGPQDDAIDSALDTGLDMAGDGVIDAARNDATESALNAGSDIASDVNVDPDLKTEDGWDEWGEDIGTKKSVSFI